MMCWLTTNRTCNMCCGWCYGKQQLPNRQANMTLDVLDRILGVLSGEAITKFVLIGGEPTVHKDLPAIIQRLYPIKVGMVTNAVKLADKRYLASLQECGLGSVLVSLKGATQEQYLENTGVACLDKVGQAIANLKAMGMPHNISITFSRPIMQSLSKVLDWMKSVDAGSISINYCRPYIVDGHVSVDGVPSPREMADETMASYGLIKESGVRCTFSFLLPLCLLPRDFIEALAARNELSTICQFQKRAGIIFEPDGSIIPCHHLFDYKLGKLGNDFSTAAEFKAFMNKERIREFYRRAGGLPDQACQSCDLRSKCGGGCLVQHLRQNPAELVFQPFERRLS